MRGRPGVLLQSNVRVLNSHDACVWPVKSLMLVKTPAGAGGAAVVLIERWFSSGAAALASWCSVGAAVVFLVQRWCSSGAAALAPWGLRWCSSGGLWCSVGAAVVFGAALVQQWCSSVCFLVQRWCSSGVFWCSVGAAVVRQCLLLGAALVQQWWSLALRWCSSGAAALVVWLWTRCAWP